MSSSGDGNRIYSVQDFSEETRKHRVLFHYFPFSGCSCYTAATEACKRISKSHILEDTCTYYIVTTFNSVPPRMRLNNCFCLHVAKLANVSQNHATKLESSTSRVMCRQLLQTGLKTGWEFSLLPMTCS